MLGNHFESWDHLIFVRMSLVAVSSGYRLIMLRKIREDFPTVQTAWKLLELVKVVDPLVQDPLGPLEDGTSHVRAFM